MKQASAIELPSARNGASSSALPFAPASASSRNVLPDAETVRQLHQAAGTPPAQVEILVWWVEHCRSQGLTTAARMAETIGKGETTVSRLLSAEYGARIDRLIEAIELFRRRATVTEQVGLEVIVPTSLTADIGGFAELARDTASIAFLWGPAGRGKSQALQLHAQQTPRTYYAPMPVGAAMGEFLQTTARAITGRDCGTPNSAKSAVFSNLGRGHLLLVDDLDLVFNARVFRAVVLDQLRTICDRTGCGMVLAGSSILPGKLENPVLREYLEQFTNRGVLRFAVPAMPTAKDLWAICAAHGLPRPEGEARTLALETVRKHGMRKLMRFIQTGRRTAGQENRPVTWDDVLMWDATIAAWASGTRAADADEDDAPATEEDALA